MRESAVDRLRGTTRSLKQCSFCEKTQDRVGRLFSGVRDAFICDECVTYYHGALAELAKTEAANNEGGKR